MKQNFTVRQGALDGVEAFLSVAQHRSFRRAAAELGVTPSAISQAVRALEARVGVALFMRTTRSVGLTEAGERFLSRAKPAFEELVAASEVARDLGQRPVGLLRLSVPRAVVPILLEPLIASFCQAYPEIEVEIAASAELVDLAAEGFDAGIRLGQFIAPDMIAVRLTPPFPLPPQRNPPRQRKPHGTAYRDIRGRAGGRIAGSLKPLAVRFRQLAFGEVRQFEIVEEQVDKFITAQNETERIFAVALTRVGRSSAAFTRTRKHVAFDEFLVSGKHHVASAAFAAKARLVHPVERNADLAAFQDIPDVAALGRFLDGALNQRLGTAQEPLAVLEAFTTRIQAPIDDVHSHCCIRPQPACFTRMYHSTSRRT